MKRALLILFALLLCSCGCRRGTPDIPSTDSTETVADTETDAPPTDDADEWLALTENGQALYAFVYWQTDLADGVSSADYAKTARLLAADWEKRSGVTFRVWSDRRIPEDITGVIAVGNVAGYAKDAFRGLRYNDFRVVGDTGCITIAAYTYSMLRIALGQMTDALAMREGNLYLKRSALLLSHEASYPIGSLTIGGAPVSDYLVDCTETEKNLAARLIETVRSTSGEMLMRAKADVAGDEKHKLIVIRKTEGLNGYRIARSGTEYRLEYGDGLSETLLRLYLENRFANVTGGEKLEMDGLVTVSERSGDRIIITLNVLNVWQNNATPGTRDDIAAAMLLSYLPDFICLQEFDVSYRKAPGGLLDQTKELYAEGNLLRGELCAEDDAPVIAQPQADDEHDRPLHGVGQQEHAVELAHAVPIVRGLEAGIVANIRAAEAEGEQAQIRDNGEYKLIDAILAVTETADHDRRIDEGDDGAQYDGDIGQHRTGTHLIDFHAGTSRKGRLLYVR